MKTEDAYDFAKEDFGFTGGMKHSTFESKLRIAGEGALLSGTLDLALTGMSPAARKLHLWRRRENRCTSCDKSWRCCNGTDYFRGFGRLMESAGNAWLGGLTKRGQQQPEVCEDILKTLLTQTT